MSPEQALKRFKTRKRIGEIALVSRQAVAQWFKAGVIPDRSQKLLRRATMLGKS
jgi:hypothetical protein